MFPHWSLNRKRGAGSIFGLALLATVLLPSSAFAQHVASHQKFDRALDDAVDRPAVGAPAVRRVIVRATPGAVGLVRDTLIASGHKIQSDLNLIDGLAVDLSTADLQALAQNPQVASLSSDAQVRASQVTTTAVSATGGSGLLRTTLGLTDQSPQGRGVGVAVIDSGISASPEFDTRISAFYDFTLGGVATLPFDDYGHGTHVAGLIGGNGTQASQYRGVAPSAHFIGLKVLDGFGAGQ